MNIDNKLVKLLTDKIKQHHQLYRFPVKGELWEDIFDQCINMSSVNGSNWLGGGHDVGTDVTNTTSGIRYQLKGGMLNFKKNLVKWSGHRTTSYNTIEEKLNFINKDHCDMYVLLSRCKREWDKGTRVYYLMMFDSSLLTYDKLSWVETFSKKQTLSGWKGNGSNNLAADIYVSMSGQLWTTADIDYLGGVTRIEV